METVNQRITRLRKAANLTQCEMAELLGLKETTYSQRERRGKIDSEFLIKLSEILKIDVKVILFGEDSPLLDPQTPLNEPSEIELLQPTPTEIAIIKLFRFLPKWRKDIFTSTLNTLYQDTKKYGKSKTKWEKERKRYTDFSV